MKTLPVVYGRHLLLAVMLAATASYAAFIYIGNTNGTPVVTGNEVLFPCVNADVKIKVCGSDVIKIRCDPDRAFMRTDPLWYPSGSFAAESEALGGPATVSATDMSTYYEIATNDLSVRCQKQPFRIAIYDKSGTMLCSDNVANGMGWDLTTNEVRCYKQTQTNENFFGLGQSLKGFNKTGQFVVNWNTDLAGGAEYFNLDYGANGNYYTSNPFFISTKGYGIFFDNTSRTRFDMGAENTQYYYFGTQAPPAAGKMIYYFIYGPNLKKVVTRYTDLTGKSFFPPRWTLGCMQSHWGYTQNQVDFQTNSIPWTYRSKIIPCDAMIVDIDWYACQCAPISWNAANFPSPVAMIQNLHSHGFKFLMIDDPNISDNQSACTQAYSQAATNSYFVRNATNGISTVGWPWGGNSGLMDFFNEEARVWWAGLHTSRLNEGVDGFWVDMNEPARYNADMRFYLSKTAYLGEIKELHNAYAIANSRAEYLMMRNYFDSTAKNNKRPFLLTRAGYAGQQKFVTTWSGDSNRDWGWLANAVFQSMSAGICGFPLFAHDVGGFWDGGHDQTLQTRWIEFGAFSPICRFHYAGSANEPWTSGTTAESVARTYIQLRYRLKPYLYTEIAKSVVFKTGLPLTRALVLDYQNDVNTYNQSSEYLFGPDLLVAPVITNAVQRNVYLPAGTWYDYWSGTTYAGGQTITNYSAPLTLLPIFVKAGAIIPLYPLMNYEGEKIADPLTWDIYPGGVTFDTLYEDEGETHAFQTGSYATTVTTVNGNVASGPVYITVGPSIGTYAGKLANRSYRFMIARRVLPNTVYLNNLALQMYADTTALFAQASGWCYMAALKSGTVIVKTAPRATANGFTVSIDDLVGVKRTGLHGARSLETWDNSVAVFDIRGRKVGTFATETSARIPKGRSTGVYLYVTKQGIIKKLLGTK